MIHVAYVRQKEAMGLGHAVLMARELVGKIPFGGGLIPKGAIAFAGTYVVGLGLDRLHRLGYGLSSAERRDSYQVAFERGKGIVELVLRGIKSGNAA